MSQRRGDGILADLSSHLSALFAARNPAHHYTRRLMTVALGGDGADELFAGYPNFLVQRFAPAMRLVPAALGQFVERLPRGEGYMNWRFLATQFAQGIGAATIRQSFLW